METMDNFKTIYRILSILEKAMDLPIVDPSIINADILGISEQRFERCIEMLTDEGYIDGVYTLRLLDGTKIVDNSDMHITLRGLEYLQEDSIMKRQHNAAKGIKTLTP